jgi:hypothetical protein
MWMRDAAGSAPSTAYFSPLPMQLALIVTVALILYTGLFPGQALDFARASVEGLGMFIR